VNLLLVLRSGDGTPTENIWQLQLDGSNQDDPVAEASRLQLQLIDVERASIARAYANNRLTDEARRRIERELDLDEARVRHALASTSLEGGDPAD
jgi:hypothetical protein